MDEEVVRITIANEAIWINKFLAQIVRLIASRDETIPMNASRYQVIFASILRS